MRKRNPNGYGCVTKLKGNRSRPYVVKVTIYDADANARQTPVGYAETEEQAYILLAQYNNNPWNVKRDKVTLVELYQQWSKVKLPKLGTSLQSSLKSAFRHCSKYYGLKYRSIRAYQMQDCIDNCGCGYSTQGAIKNLWGHLDRFAFELDIIDKMYSTITTAPPIPDTTRQPFTAEQVDALWEIQSDEWVNTVLIYLYTGFRLTELLNMKTEQVNTQDWSFQGGIKSASGKGRIVPVHTRIRPLVQSLVDQGNKYLFTYQGRKISQTQYYTFWKEVMTKIEADKTPHEARHTFETMLDNAGGNRKCIDMLMGHKSKDVGNRVYNHKTIEQLRDTIELLK
ncbi:MAG: tyrosine-type recombinase/integrase [bacterium]|nr:tyrosine-type recombinase/integrase [bacterium]MCM1373568.1 tyrosine-type recombinase/integrase [Muribaculum sp.]